MKRADLVRMGLGEVTHTRISAGGSSPGITTAKVISRGEKTKSKFHPPARVPNKEEQRLMLALILEITILAVMGKHMYSFNGDVRLQLVGGPIGLKLSGVLAKVYMLYWSRHFQNIITRVTRNRNCMLYLCKLYVDDNNLAMEELEPGSRW